MQYKSKLFNITEKLYNKDDKNGDDTFQMKIIQCKWKTIQKFKYIMLTKMFHKAV